MTHTSSPTIASAPPSLPNQPFFAWLRTQTALFVGQILALLGAAGSIVALAYYVGGLHVPANLITPQAIGIIVIYAHLLFLTIFILWLIRVLDDNKRGTYRASRVYDRLVEKGEFGIDELSKEEREKLAKDSADQVGTFKLWFLKFWCTMLFLYIFFAVEAKYEEFSQFFLPPQSNSLVEWHRFVFPFYAFVANNVSLFFIFCCFVVLYLPPKLKSTSQSPEDFAITRQCLDDEAHEHRSLQRKMRWCFGVPLGIFTLTYLLIFCFKNITNDNWGDYKAVFNALSGTLNAVVVALMIARLDSKLIGLPPWLISILYFYSGVQPLFVVFGQQLDEFNVIRIVVLVVVFIFKLYFFLIIVYSLQNGRLLNYFYCSPLLNQHIRKEVSKDRREKRNAEHSSSPTSASQQVDNEVVVQPVSANKVTDELVAQPVSVKEGADGEHLAPPASASKPVDGEHLVPPASTSQPADGEHIVLPASTSKPVDDEHLVPPASASQPADGEHLVPPASASQPVDGEHLALPASASQPVDGEQSAPASPPPAKPNGFVVESQSESLIVWSTIIGWIAIIYFVTSLLYYAVTLGSNNNTPFFSPSLRHFVVYLHFPLLLVIIAAAIRSYWRAITETGGKKSGSVANEDPVSSRLRRFRILFLCFWFVMLVFYGAFAIRTYREPEKAPLPANRSHANDKPSSNPTSHASEKATSETVGASGESHILNKPSPTPDRFETSQAHNEATPETGRASQAAATAAQRAKQAQQDSTWSVGFSVLTLFLNNFMAFFIFLCFSVLYLAVDDRHGAKKYNSLKNHAILICLLLTAIIPLLLFSIDRNTMAIANPAVATTVIAAVGGVLNAVAFALLFARLDSRLIRLPSLVISVLYAYSALQSLFVVFQRDAPVFRAIETSALVTAFFFKICFLMVILHALGSGRLGYHLRKFPFLNNRVNSIFDNQYEIKVYRTEKQFKYSIFKEDHEFYRAEDQYPTRKDCDTAVVELIDLMRKRENYVHPPPVQGIYWIQVRKWLDDVKISSKILCESKALHSKTEVTDLIDECVEMVPYCKYSRD